MLHLAHNQPAKRPAPIKCEWVHPDLQCQNCEDGLVWTSRHGGNDPDVRFDGNCEECDGEGNVTCSIRFCGATAEIASDGECYCADHAPAFDELFEAEAA